MALSVGARLGSYEVTAKIGEGGMGEVYRARDTKLDRDVADHPNIAAIHGLEESEGTPPMVPRAFPEQPGTPPQTDP